MPGNDAVTSQCAIKRVASCI